MVAPDDIEDPVDDGDGIDFGTGFVQQQAPRNSTAGT